MGPGIIGGMCINCGEKNDNDNRSCGVFGYIHKDLRFANAEIAQRFKEFVTHKKLYSV